MLEELGPELAGVDVRNRLRSDAVACAPGVLAQVLRNLLTNALKFRSHERPLRVTLESQGDERLVTLIVEDNGMGMDDESASHAFEPFFRARGEREVPGAGLGLAIVQRAVRSLGGTCRLDLVPSGGIRLVVTLPRA